MRVIELARGPRLFSAQLWAVDGIQVVSTGPYRVELLVNFRGLIDGVAFLRERDTRWWVGEVPAVAVRLETARFVDQVRVVLVPDRPREQRFFQGVDWQARIPGFTQDPESDGFDRPRYLREVAAYNRWMTRRSITFCCWHPRSKHRHTGVDLLASCVHPDAQQADQLNARRRRLRQPPVGRRTSAEYAPECGTEAPVGA